jgi:hypothetical protein
MKIQSFVFAMLAAGCVAGAQTSPTVIVDDQGVMRWRESGEEVALFGVNYTTPFAHAFRAHRRLGVSWRDAIDRDVYHLARLGFDAYRVHIWDREISDAEGNLLANEHVEAHDYLLAKLKERGIKTILTPLQFGNAGYPEPGVQLPGFSSGYGKSGCLENRESWPLQERYLAQFASHVNPFTGLAYKDDPDVIAFEICNEPGHSEYESALEYINRMTQALRGAGVQQPVFYNMSHGLPVFAAYLDANIQGGTFQWYPAGLVAGHEQRGNFLPYVDRYQIPFADDSRFKAKAKMVYEFDAADIGRSYIYPAMARTFRTAGMQFATHFAYDPLAISPFNTEYQTHYLNLAYSPSKALGMMVAGEAFRRVPRGHDYGSYPGNSSFAGIRVSYEGDLAEVATDNTLIYSNSTRTTPEQPELLTKVAGFGSSPVVEYGGGGAYFLDRLEPGVWRLEVMPDAIWVRDPFERPSPHKQVARIAWRSWTMRVQLPDLGDDFAINGLDVGNDFEARGVGGAFNIRPGAYLLIRDGTSTSLTRDSNWHNIRLGEFVAPLDSMDRIYVLHDPVAEAAAGRDLPVRATVVGPQPVDEVRLVYFPASTFASDGEGAAPTVPGQPGRFNQAGPGAPVTGGAVVMPMERTGAHEFAAMIPAGHMGSGMLRYDISVRVGEDWTTFPSGAPSLPPAWDFAGEPWTLSVASADAPVPLFDAGRDSDAITADWRDLRFDLVPSERPGVVAMKMSADDLYRGEHDRSFRFYFRDKIGDRRDDLSLEGRLVLYGRSADEAPVRVQLALVTSDGVAFGGMVTVNPKWGACPIDIAELKPVRMPNIPHGYPRFIPFWSEPPNANPLELQKIESVMVSIGPEIAETELDQPHRLLIERIWIE